MLNWYETDIANVESFSNFVDMKRLQNEISQISTDLTRNLKIRIISILVLYQYFFEIFHFHIESNLIDIESYRYRYRINTKSNLIIFCIVFCIDFSISPIPAHNTDLKIAGPNPAATCTG
jgi:hypothetical protein